MLYPTGATIRNGAGRSCSGHRVFRSEKTPEPLGLADQDQVMGVVLAEDSFKDLEALLRSQRPLPARLEVEVLGRRVAAESHPTSSHKGQWMTMARPRRSPCATQCIMLGCMGRLEAAGHGIITGAEVSQNRRG